MRPQCFSGWRMTGTSQFVSQPTDGGLPNRMPLASERLPQLADRLARPSDPALWITFRVPHLFQIASQRGIRDRPLFPATALLADALPGLIQCSCLTGDLADPSLTNAPGLARYIQPPLALVEQSLHQLVLGFR